MVAMPAQVEMPKIKMGVVVGRLFRCRTKQACLTSADKTGCGKSSLGRSSERQSDQQTLGLETGQK